VTTLSAALLLFLVMDPFGNIPLFLIYLRGLPPERQRRVVCREMLIALVVLVAFLVCGRFMMGVLHVSESSLGIAGGIILFMIAAKMVFSGSEQMFGGQCEGEPFIVPLAIPLVAGPSSIATVMLLMARQPERWSAWLLALVAAWVVSGLILLGAPWFSRALGTRALTALERLMGLLLTTVAVEMFMQGVRRAFADFTG
jgi:MarC family membrane protein